MVSMFDMGRQFDQRTAASVFGTLEDARRTSASSRIYLFAANLDWGVDKEELLKRVQAAARRSGHARPATCGRSSTTISNGFNRLLLLVSTVAFAAMAVASLGVTNTSWPASAPAGGSSACCAASASPAASSCGWCSPRRSCSASSAVALGLAAGFQMSARRQQPLSRHHRLHPADRVPWGIIWIGVGIVMAISLLASLWPAISVAQRAADAAAGGSRIGIEVEPRRHEGTKQESVGFIRSESQISD